MIIMVGPPGAGKSLQGQILAARYGYDWISVGKVLRATMTGDEQKLLKSGEMLPDNITNQVVARHLDKYDSLKGVILDGYPRDIDQARALVDYMHSRQQKIDLVLVLDVGRAEILRRLTRRGRSDDTPAAIERRLQIFGQNSQPILDYFAYVGVRVARMPSAMSVGAVHDSIAALLERSGIVE